MNLAPSKRLNGFTLIELLVVIAIIAILAAILFPVFAQAREKARQATCISNERQVGMGFLQYSQDYDELLPYRSGTTGSQVIWPVSIMPYLKSIAVFSCPDDTTKSTVGYAQNPPLSYAVNQNVLTSPGNAIPKFNAPASTVLIAEQINNTIDFTTTTPNNYDTICMTFGRPGWGVELVTGHMGSTGSANWNRPPRHTGSADFLALDGHTKFLQGARVSPGLDASSESGNETGGTYGSAAGTANGSFGMTFSKL